MLGAPFALLQGRRLIRTRSASDGQDVSEIREMPPRACAWGSDGSRELKFAACGGGVRDLLDLMVLSLPMPMVLAKVACLFNGCCFGEPCNWSWCIVFPYGAEAPAGIARHPTQAYEIIVLLFIWFVLVTLDRRRWTGLLTLWFGFLYGLGRPLTEFFRVPSERRPSVGFLSTSQAICLAGAVVAVIALWMYRPPRRTFKAPSIKTVPRS
jgi:prolipoprotein diacylglyceryltransferase